MDIQELNIQILVENVAGPEGTLGENGFSALAKVTFTDLSSLTLLFDTGPSPVAFLRNIEKLEVDVATIDAIVLSHGHWDHVGGLPEVLSSIKKRIPLICHPQALSPKVLREKGKTTDVGIQEFFESTEDLKKQVRLVTSTTPYELTDSVMTTGEIPRRNDYEVLSGNLKDVTTVKNGKEIPDMLEDDLSIIFHMANDSLVILAGCCHTGIVNTTTLATELTDSRKIVGIIGGLHLKKATEIRLSNTVQELKKYPIKIMAPCHCSEFRGKVALSLAFEKQFHDISVASTIKFEVA